MIIEDIIQSLKTDESVKGFVGDRITAFSSGTTKDCIIYTFAPQTDNAVLRTDKLELTIISKSIDRMYAIHEAVKTRLLTFGDRPYNGAILTIEANGGGVLENIKTGTFHHTTFYYIGSRSNEK